MKKNLITLIIATTILLSACQSQPASSEFIQELNAGSRQPKLNLDLLPKDAIIPHILPDTIRDPLLLTAWVYLYNQEDTFQVWDGSNLNGKELAQFIIDHKIPVMWGSAEICSDHSCTPRPVCKDEKCIETFSEIGDYPIYISQRFQDSPAEDLPLLAGSLAHEIYHHLEPHGKISSTLFEEYWAFFVSKQISQDKSLDFKGYKPLNPACLKLWLVQNNRTGYKLDLYPASVVTSVDTNHPNCSLNVP